MHDVGKVGGMGLRIRHFLHDVEVEGVFENLDFPFLVFTFFQMQVVEIECRKAA